MPMTVNERARTVATFRHIEVRLMETIAAWTPTTPEMEVKVLFGRHIWDFAQHADALGKRTFELRQPMHYTLPPENAYADLLQSVASVRSTAERLAAMYDVVLPGLTRRYEAYVAGTDPILDEPTTIIMERIVRDLKRQIDQAKEIAAEIGVLAADVGPLTHQERSIGRFVSAGR